MPNINTAIRYLPRAGSNPNHHDWTKRFASADNAEFLAEVARSMGKLAGARAAGMNGVACIGLIGEYGLVGYRIRQTEAALRIDRTPSHWSHAFLLVDELTPDAARYRNKRQSPWLWESALQPAPAFDHFARRYGVGPRRLADYVRSTFDLNDPHCVPNIAIVAVGLTPEEKNAILDRADQPAIDQLHYDIPALLGSWGDFVSRRDERPSPLADGHAVPSSAYVQLAYEAAGIDLAPGAHQRNISPEHIWQTASFLYRQLAPITLGKKQGERPVFAWSCTRDKACVIAPPDAEVPSTMGKLMGRAGPRRG